jgi:hypothetical protein
MPRLQGCGVSWEQVFSGNRVGVRHAALTPLAPLSQVGRGGYPEGVGVYPQPTHGAQKTLPL